jgi:hypothetical protein
MPNHHRGEVEARLDGKPRSPLFWCELTDLSQELQ